MAADDRVGFVIDEKFYPFPVSFRLADPVLVEELTGLAWDEFTERLPGDDTDGNGSDPVALVGLVGVAVWQQNPRWRRDRVIRFIQSVDQDAIEFQAPDEPDEGLNGGPPPEEAGVTAYETSASSSGSDSESRSTTSTPERSGPPTSPTSPAEPSDQTT